MKTIQMTIDEQLLLSVDQAVEEMGTNRSAFIREALKSALRQFRIRQMERQHAAGYARYPQDPAEIAEWETEQVWEDE
ncbi:MAG: ribbon-helix-helix domain-containing protein [Caldilineaceae bacterium]